MRDCRAELSNALGKIKKLKRDNSQLRRHRREADLRWFSIDWERRYWKERAGNLQAKITRKRKHKPPA